MGVAILENIGKAILHVVMEDWIGVTSAVATIKGEESMDKD